MDKPVQILFLLSVSILAAACGHAREADESLQLAVGHSRIGPLVIGESAENALKFCDESSEAYEGYAAMTVSLVHACKIGPATILVELGDCSEIASLRLIDGEANIAGMGTVSIGDSLSEVRGTLQNFEMSRGSLDIPWLSLVDGPILVSFQVEDIMVLSLPDQSFRNKVASWEVDSILVRKLD